MIRRLLQAMAVSAACSALLIWQWPAPKVEAQPSPGQAFFIGSPPGGIGAACASNVGYLTAAGQVVTCVSSVWTVSAGGGGSGTVSSATGNKLGRYASTGTTIGGATTTEDSSGNVTISGSLNTGSAGTASGIERFLGLTSGEGGFAAADVAGTAVVYVLPTANPSTGQFLADNGSATCPTLPAGSPSNCRQLIWTSSSSTPSLYAYATNTGTQAVTGGSQNALTFGTNSAGSSSSMHSTSVQPTRFLAPSTGRYHGVCQAVDGSPGSGVMSLAFRKNGTDYMVQNYFNPNTGGSFSFSVSVDLELTSGDYVECMFQPVSNGNMSDTAGGPGTSVMWVQVN